MRDSLSSLASALKSSGAPGNRNHPVAALLLVTASMALLVGIAAVARSVAIAGVDPLQIMFFRNFFCVLLMLPLLYRRGWSLMQTSQPKLYGFRVAVSFIAMLRISRRWRSCRSPRSPQSDSWRRSSAPCSPSPSLAST